MELTLPKESVVVEELKAVEIMRSRRAQFIYDRNYNRIGLSHGVISIDCKAVRIFAYSSTREQSNNCLLYTSPSPRDGLLSRMPSSA